MQFDKDYWNRQYKKDKLVWDIGYPSTPIKAYIDQLENKELKILIPGCGNAYEADYLIEKGFPNVYLLDWSEIALENFKKRKHTIPDDHLFCEDFFEHNDKYDLIIEQTLFCSIDTSERSRYANKMHELLNEKGKLVGLLFDRTFEGNEPPFGGSKEEYITYFLPYFELKVFEPAYNSIKPRAGREIFMILVKK
jgi:SAM-dependent methyltransferase